MNSEFKKDDFLVLLDQPEKKVAMQIMEIWPSGSITVKSKEGCITKDKSKFKKLNEADFHKYELVYSPYFEDNRKLNI